jgi:glucosyl-3-phosphoglycerate synthase
VRAGPCQDTRGPLIRSFHHSEFPLELLRERKRAPVTVVLPAREVAATIGPIVERLLGLGDLIDQLLVVDAASEDGTAELAAGLGAEVRQEAELMPEFGPPSGKGDAMWRALSAARGAIVVYLDSDTREFSEHFATGLLGPLVCHPELSFVKAFYRRPFTTPEGRTLPSGGGRVTELTARPLLSAFYPDLAGFAQPLAGELAARRELLVQLPFATGYAVETAMLLNARDLLGGTEAMAQVDLDERLNQHQSLAELGPMAYGVLGVVLRRLRDEGRLTDTRAGTGEALPPLQTADGRLVELELAERPPLQSVGSRA